VLCEELHYGVEMLLRVPGPDGAGEELHRVVLVPSRIRLLPPARLEWRI
jgi:hypothetical protein